MSAAKTIKFEPGKAYEVTGIWVQPENMQALSNYFNKVFPIAMKNYGIKPLFSLQPLSVYSGDFMPQIMFVNEWPSIDSFQSFINDPQVKELFPERDAVVSRLVVSHYSVPEPVEVELSEGDVVEYAAMWIKPGQEQALKSYYQQAFPIAVQNGLKPISPLAPLSSYRGDFLPHRAGLNLWGRKERFDRFVSAAQSLFPKRDASLQRLEVVHAEVRFEGGK